MAALDWAVREVSLRRCPRLERANYRKLLRRSTVPTRGNRRCRSPKAESGYRVVREEPLEMR